ncbi:acyl-CoA carboxylase epsilon subunit [Streptomyces sp. NPDC060000]|uniref:acyl-CoA carboxylase epsilon subunit n=1 Tax=Streptomyces sp. NPDC060000 TaxID=3347031 RepID=UPI0036C4C76D
MSRSESTQALIRVERGDAGEEELAALALVFLALLANSARCGPARPGAGPHRWRGDGAYRAPDSWQ